MQNKLEICKNCKKSKRDFKLGLICGVTGKKPDFKEVCELFEHTKEYYDEIEANKPVVTITRKWKCDNCNEINEDSFELCWKCKKWKDDDDEIIETKHIGKSKNEEVFEKRLEKGQGKRYIMESILLAFFTFGMGTLLNSFLGLRLSGPSGKVLPNNPELMFLFLILYDILYLINYFTYVKDVQTEFGFSLFKKGIIINVILVGFYVVGKAIT